MRHLNDVLELLFRKSFFIFMRKRSQSADADKNTTLINTNNYQSSIVDPLLLLSSSKVINISPSSSLSHQKNNTTDRTSSTALLLPIITKDNLQLPIQVLQRMANNSSTGASNSGIIENPTLNANQEFSKYEFRSVYV